MTLCRPLSLSNPREHKGHFRLECTFSSDRLKNACDPLTVARSLEKDKEISDQRNGNREKTTWEHGNEDMGIEVWSEDMGTKT